MVFRLTNGGTITIPGAWLISEGNGWYYYTLPNEVWSTYLIFRDPNNPDINKTPELYIDKPHGGHWYYRGPETDNSGWQDTRPEKPTPTPMPQEPLPHTGVTDTNSIFGLTEMTIYPIITLALFMLVCVRRRKAEKLDE